VETPGGSVALLDQAMVRVDVDSGQTRVSVYRGEAVLDDGRERVRLSEGERTYARWGGGAEQPESFEIEPEDDFARWDDERESEERWAARSSEYLPAELDPYAGELDRNGSWRYEAAVGYVWSPRVAVGWSPYTSGHWSWTPYGWTWVPYETWGWAPSHYGRWGFSASFGWYWSPGRTWGPAWVSWGVGHGYVGWCPLGWRDKPVYPWQGSFNQQRGYAVARGGGRGPHGGWNVVREGDFARRDVARSRVALAGIDPQALRVGESPSFRPTRDGRALRASNEPVRAISRRPTPGDFVRELSVDNKTTIPAPWLRGSQPRGGSEPRDARDRAASRRRSNDPGVAGVSGTEAPAPAAVVPQGGSQARSRGSSRSVPWYAPREESGSTGATAAATSDRGARTRQTQSSQRNESSRQRDTQAYRRTEPRPRVETEARESAPPAQSLGARRLRESEARGNRSRPERSEPRAERAAPRSSDSGSSRSYDSSSRSRGDSGSSRPSDSGASRSSNNDSGSRSSNGGGGAMRSAPRPPRNRN
jgi:hypothetical protein